MENSDYLKSVIPNRILYIVSLNHFTNDGSTYLISALFPVMMLQFGFSEYQIGVLVGIGYLMNLVFQPVTGRYSERYEARKLLVLGISMIVVSMLLLAASTGFALILIAILILRFGSSFYHPVGVSAVSRTYRGKKLDSSMGFQSAFGNLGILLPFLFSTSIYLTLGWGGPFFIYAALGIGTAIITAATMRIRNQKPSLVVEDPSPVKTERKFSIGLPFFFVVSAFVTGGSYAIVGNFGNLFLFHHGFGLSFSNYLMAVWVVSAFAGAILVGRITKGISRLKLLALSYVLAGLSSLVFGFSSYNLPIAILGLLVNGFALSMTYPILYSELSAHLGAGSKGRGFAFGILFSSQIGGSSLLGFVGGYIGAIFGLQLVFEISALLLFCSLAVVFLWSRRQ